MASEICPTIDAETLDEYREQMQRVQPFVVRVHIDVADGSMTPNRLVDIDQVSWPANVRADIHVMYRQPEPYLRALIALGPQLVIFHAEASGDFIGCAQELQRHGIEAGVALLPETPVDTIVPALEYIDHALIFSGNIGHFGGKADLGLLDKVKRLKAAKPTIEIGWDGGVNKQNAAQLAAGGVDVLNTGGFIHHADDPQDAYAILGLEILSVR